MASSRALVRVWSRASNLSARRACRLSAPSRCTTIAEGEVQGLLRGGKCESLHNNHARRFICGLNNVEKSGIPKRYGWGGRVLPGLPIAKPIQMTNGGHQQYTTAGLPAHLELTMPALSPTMTMGNVVSWKKKEGDQVLPGDVLCEIETDKATLDNESQEEGFLAKILIPAGSREVKVGSLLAILVDSREDVAKFANYTGPAGSSGIAASTPAMGQKKSEEVKNSPAASSIAPSSKMGPSVRKLLEELGLDISQIVPTGPQRIVTKGDVISAVAARGSAKPAAATRAEKTAALPVGKEEGHEEAEVAKPPPKPAASSSASSSAPPVYKPLKLPPADPSTYKDIPVSQIRKVIATRLLQSKWSIPHLYFDTDVRLDSLMSWRKELKANQGISISVNDIIIRAAALALRQVPQANASWNEKTQEIVFNDSVDVCVAVATDKGLITPIVRNADKKSLSSISAEVKDLAERARLGKLKPAEFQGGSFTISNLGMFGMDNFSAIINPPQACILAVGRGAKGVVWEESAGGEGRPAVVMKMSASLSTDHRVFDADVAGQFLKSFQMNMEDPSSMLG